MSRYLQARARRRRALAASRAARAHLRSAVAETADAYRTHPLPALAAAAGTGFVLARLRIGSALMRGTVQLASGPGWRLLRQYLQI